MGHAKMHADEPDIDEALVGRLLADQFPHWAGLPIRRTPSWGTDNAMYRLGDDLVARLPRRPGQDATVAKEHRWLPRLAPRLPLRIPTPVALGTPAHGYPHTWSVYDWLPGEAARLDRLADPADAARRLAGFLEALQALDTDGAPRPGASNFGRGIPLARRDTAFREALSRLHDEIDTAAALAAWERALAAPDWDRDPVWIHGDLAGGNMLVRDGRLSAVIDFGALAVGDPAVELLAAWTFFDGPARAVFRESLGVDDATWERGRGWGLSTAVIALPYYLHTYPGIVEQSRYQIKEVLSES